MLQGLFMLSVSQEVYSRKVRRSFNRRELFEDQCGPLAFRLLVNIDRSFFYALGRGIKRALREEGLRDPYG